jgi:nucleoside-diphosphate-sugar epimerase
MKHILVFGKNGFIGKSFCNFLTANKVKYTGYSSDDINLLEEETSKKLNLIEKNSYQIFFFSALTPDKGKDEITLIRNLTMIKNFFVHFPKDNIDHFYYISSDAVYSLDDQLITDKTIPNPQDLYGLMHLTREKIVESHIVKDKITILRLTGVFGFGDTHNSYGPNRFIKSAIKDRKIQIFGKGDDIRSHVYIDDVIKVFAEIIKDRIAGTYCVSSEHSYSFIEIANFIKDDYKKKDVNIDIIFHQNTNKTTKRYFKDLFVFNKNTNLKKNNLKDNILNLIRSSDD